MTTHSFASSSFYAFGLQSWAMDSHSNAMGSIPIIGAVSGARRIVRAVKSINHLSQEDCRRQAEIINIISHIFRGILEFIGVGIIASIYDLASITISLAIVVVVHLILGIIVAVGRLLKESVFVATLPATFMATGVRDLFKNQSL